LRERSGDKVRATQTPDEESCDKTDDNFAVTCRHGSTRSTSDPSDSGSEFEDGDDCRQQDASSEESDSLSRTRDKPALLKKRRLSQTSPNGTEMPQKRPRQDHKPATHLKLCRISISYQDVVAKGPPTMKPWTVQAHCVEHDHDVEVDLTS